MMIILSHVKHRNCLFNLKTKDILLLLYFLIDFSSSKQSIIHDYCFHLSKKQLCRVMSICMHILCFFACVNAITYIYIYLCYPWKKRMKKNGYEHVLEKCNALVRRFQRSFGTRLWPFFFIGFFSWVHTYQLATLLIALVMEEPLV